MVIGNTALPPIESTQLTPQLNSLSLTPLSSPVKERDLKFTDSVGASPSSPKPVKRRGKLSSFPPMAPANLFQTPLSPNCQQAMSTLTPITNSSLMVPASTQATPYVPPSKAPPARKMLFCPYAAVPPVVDECSQCKDNKKMIKSLATQNTEVVDVLMAENKTLKIILVDMIKNCICNRNKENKVPVPFRGRLKTF